MLDGHAGMAWACIKDAQRVLNEEFALNEATNLFEKKMPEWAARIRDLLHAANEHMSNEADCR